MHVYRITEQAELEGTPRITESSSWPCTGHPMCLRALSKRFLNSASFGAVPTAWGARSVPNHPLGEESFPDIQPKPPLTQPHATPVGPVPGGE